MSDSPRITLPVVDWKQTSCVVCGRSFDYSGQRKPKVCRDGQCRYRFTHKVDQAAWAGYQFGLFDRPGTRPTSP